MKKTLLLLLVSAASCISAWSASYDKLTVNLADQTTMDIVLKETVVISFDQQNFIVTGSTKDVTIPKETILSFEHGQSNSVSDAMVGSDFEFNNGLIFHNLPADSHIFIYDVAGNTEFSVVAQGEYYLSIDTLLPGIHIVYVNGKTYKIHIK